ncbi:MAG: glycosyltransferase [Candidatus Wallbacteria bacterium]|nr:glycosyltransferase [Candidatus Wallbacteria bacterium]
MTISLVVYNGARYLPVALKSALEQTYPNFDVLVVDDCSTDDSADIVRDFQRRDPRVRLCSHARNLGVGAARRTAVANALSDWLVLLDADDRLLPGSVETQLAVLAENPEARAIVGRAHYINAAGERIGAATVLPLSRERLRGMASRGEPVGFIQTGALVHRPTILALGNYRADMATAEDVDLWIRMMEQEHLIVTHEAFIGDCRMHSASTTARVGTLSQLRWRWLEAQMQCRRDGRPEVGWEDFLMQIRVLPVPQKLALWRLVYRERLYRKAGVARAEGAWLTLAWSLTLAFLLSPGFVIRRLWSWRFAP